MSNNQTGFTLIELMISIALGLMVTAAAVLLFLTGQKSLAIQQGQAEIQDNGNFGLNLITENIRLANLATSKAEINDTTAYGGVVLTSAISSDVTKDSQGIALSNLYRSIVGATAASNLLTKSSVGPSNVQEGTNNLLSDQLTIQYMPEYTIETRSGVATYIGGFDCEGNELAYPVQANNRGRRIVVERYFVREDANKETGEPNQSLVLACDAGTYQPPVSVGNQEPTAVTDFGGNGAIIMKRVDYLHIMLGIENGVTFRYISVSDYMSLAKPRPRIVSIQLGTLVRSSQSVGKNTLEISDDQEFRALEKTIKVKKPAANAPKYLRQVVSQNVALRNAVGGRGS